jgi:2-oxo-3-hexenedioate decarboxylase/2-keto-4-pentenoate hydratase
LTPPRSIGGWVAMFWGTHNSVAWLAEHLADTGGSLRAGDIVMTGNLVTTKFPPGPCSYQFELRGLGSVGILID